jgi:hypothetical protein
MSIEAFGHVQMSSLYLGPDGEVAIASVQTLTEVSCSIQDRVVGVCDGLFYFARNLIHRVHFTGFFSEIFNSFAKNSLYNQATDSSTSKVHVLFMTMPLVH